MPLFGPQREFVNDPATFVTADCSRRAGKSEGAGTRLLRSGIQKPDAPNLYFTTTRKEAKRIMWEKLLKLNHETGAGYEPIESELVFKRRGRAMIYLTGCDNQTEIGKMRGTGWNDVIGDEAQLFPVYLKPLVLETLLPSLMDHKGAIRLLGTPAPVPVGYFYEVCQSPKWKHHRWSAFDNPHVDAKALLVAALEMRGVPESDPSIQREFYGRWVYDPNALVFRLSDGNLLSEVPSGEWETVIGVDLGFDDADAIAVLGFAPGRAEAHLREECVVAKQTITQLAERLAALIEKYQPLAVVMDTGGLGKKIAEEMRKRFALPIRAAERVRKFEYIELLNDAMRSGKFFVLRGSRFAQDAMLVEWDKEKSTNDKLVVSDRFHSDICDAVLYAYRESLHWLHETAKREPLPGTPEWYAKEEAEMEEYQIEIGLAEQQAQEEAEAW